MQPGMNAGSQIFISVRCPIMQACALNCIHVLMIHNVQLVHKQLPSVFQHVHTTCTESTFHTAQLQVTLKCTPSFSMEQGAWQEAKSVNHYYYWIQIRILIQKYLIMKCSLIRILIYKYLIISMWNVVWCGNTQKFHFSLTQHLNHWYNQKCTLHFEQYTWGGFLGSKSNHYGYN